MSTTNGNWSTWSKHWVIGMSDFNTNSLPPLQIGHSYHWHVNKFWHYPMRMMEIWSLLIFYRFHTSNWLTPLHRVDNRSRPISHAKSVVSKFAGTSVFKQLSCNIYIYIYISYIYLYIYVYVYSYLVFIMFVVGVLFYAAVILFDK